MCTFATFIIIYGEHIYYIYIYMVNIYMLIALWCMHTVLRTYLPYARTRNLPSLEPVRYHGAGEGPPHIHPKKGHHRGVGRAI